MKEPADKHVILERGLTGFGAAKGDRIYAKAFDRHGKVLFHGLVADVVIEILGPKVKP